MSRGHEDNRALVITTNDQLEEHSRRVPMDAIRTLTQVLQRDGTDRSAHEVLRRNLSRFDDELSFRELVDESNRRLDELVGPDFTAEIEALRDRVRHRWMLGDLTNAEGALVLAQRRADQAEQELAATLHEPLRAHLPGALCNEVRDEHQRRCEAADPEHVEARRVLQEARAALEHARAKLVEAAEV